MRYITWYQSTLAVVPGCLLRAFYGHQDGRNDSGRVKGRAIDQAGGDGQETAGNRDGIGADE